jgi:hypothetical protein
MGTLLGRVLVSGMLCALEERGGYPYISVTRAMSAAVMSGAIMLPLEIV